MRHGISGNKFGRNQKWREATIRDLVRAILKSESIKTTRAKAVEARKAADKIITLGKKNTLAAKRRAFAILCDHSLVSRLFNVIAPRFANRNGGYTRLIKFAVNRQGDNAEMVLLELTERVPETPSADAKPAEVVKEAEVVETKAARKTPAKKAVEKAAEKSVEKPAEKKPATKKASAKKAVKE